MGVGFKTLRLIVAEDNLKFSAHSQRAALIAAIRRGLALDFVHKVSVDPIEI